MKNIWQPSKSHLEFAYLQCHTLFYSKQKSKRKEKLVQALSSSFILSGAFLYDHKAADETRIELFEHTLQTMDPTITALIEIFIIYGGLLVIYSFVRGSTGDSALKGIAIVLGVMFVIFYLAASLFKLYRIELLLEKLIDYLLFGLLIIFQPELRRGVIRLGQNRFFSTLVKNKEDVISLLTQATFRLARLRIGTLLVIERGVRLGNYADRGTLLDAKLTPELLQSIFHPGNALHDGAVIIRGFRVLSAGTLLPLTENVSISKHLGTRHRAAIGISEESDAISIVVSEESGRVSLASRGQLFEDLDRETLEQSLRSALEDAETGSSEVWEKAEVSS